MIETKIAKYGNSLSVRLPAAFARELDFSEGDRVMLRRVEGGVVIERQVRARLMERLATVREREDELASGNQVGAEIFD